MEPNELIDSYVDDVVRRLPGPLRGDVGLELRSLLNDELQAKAEDAGRPADPAMTLALLAGFGRPAEVADRYRPGGFLIVRPSEAHAFALTCLLAVAVQWALTLPGVFLQPEAFPGQAFARLGSWWLTWGLGSFWAPGLLVVITVIVRWAGHRWPRPDSWSLPRAVDTERVNRPLAVLALIAWAVGAAIVVSVPWIAPRLPGLLPRIFAFDAGFLRTHAPWLLPVWAADFMVHAVATAEGRWRRLTRRLHLAFSAAVCALLVWFVAGGPIFTAKATDGAAKGIIGLTVLLSLIGLGAELHRELARVRRGVGLAPGGA